MKYDEIKDSLQKFDDFVNIAISANIKGVNVYEVVTAYNKIRDFINQQIQFGESEETKE